MKKTLFVLFILSLPAQAQIVGPDTLAPNFNSIRQNGISSGGANSDTIWVSPALTRNIDNSPDWIRPTGIDSIDNGIGRGFSISVNKDTVFAGLGFTSETVSGNQPSGYGYYISTDGGENWRFSDFLLDNRINADTTFVYGGQTYARKRIIVPEQSPPYNVDFRGDILFSTNWASGLLRSTDFGFNWERIVLPPTGTSLLSPEQTDYYWRNCASSTCGEDGNVYNSIFDNNLLGFAVHIDSQNRVWYGSAAGINVSENALTAPIDSVIWRNTNSNNVSSGLLGNWIIEIQEDTSTGKVWMTNWIADQGDRFGIVSTDDGGQTFEQYLIGEKILGIGFKDGYIFAAGENGLFISPNGGDSWQKSPQIKSANTLLKESAEFQAVATTTARVWIGTSDGLISTNDLGETWEITRVNFPLSGGNQYDSEAKSVKAYAYPNPYSPQLHEITRIRFEVDNPGTVRIRIFDFGMNLVRDLDTYNASVSGTHEAIWDGVDGKGRNVANGPYFYIIETPDETINGKILLIE